MLERSAILLARKSERAHRELLNHLSLGAFEMVDSIAIVRNDLVLEEVESDGTSRRLLEGGVANIVDEIVELVPAALGVLVANVLAREGAAGGREKVSERVDKESGKEPTSCSRAWPYSCAFRQLGWLGRQRRASRG